MDERAELWKLLILQELEGKKPERSARIEELESEMSEEDVRLIDGIVMNTMANSQDPTDI